MLPTLVLSSRSTPSSRLPEITLRALAVEPPTVLFEAPAFNATPSPLLPMAEEPAALVPMWLPTTRLLLAAAPLIQTPVALPESTLRSAAARPPRVLLLPST